MDKEITKLKGCLAAMKKCLKIPHVENCICFSAAFKVLNAEVSDLSKRADQLSNTKSKEGLKSIQKEIEEIQKIISDGDKECLGCGPCVASVVFKAYPTKLDNLYLDNEL